MMKKTYAYHKPSAKGMASINEIRQLFSDLHGRLELLCPQGREKAITFTNLETAAMWAIKSVVCNDPESEVSL